MPPTLLSSSLSFPLSHTHFPPPLPSPLQVSDADDSDIISKSGEEEDRNVGKLLMFLGSNVTNRRERDARMQRCLQESGNEKAPGQEQRKKLEMSRKMRLSSGKEGGEGDVEQLHGFWSALPAERRQMLCRVGAMEAEGAILSKEKEALKEKEKEEKKKEKEGGGNGGKPAAAAAAEAEAEEPAGPAGSQLMQLLHQSLMRSSELTTGGFRGLALIDCLCDLEDFMAEAMGAAELETTGAARGLFRVSGGESVDLCVPLTDPSPHTSEWPSPPSTASSSGGKGGGQKGSQKENSHAAVTAPTSMAGLPPGQQQRPRAPTFEEASILLERLLAVEAGLDTTEPNQVHAAAAPTTLPLTTHHSPLTTHTTHHSPLTTPSPPHRCPSRTPSRPV